jgi:uncharacterized membrane protein
MALLSNLYLILVLRLAHIAGGILWVGGAILYLFLLIPAAASAESAGKKFMQTLGPRFGMLMRIVTTVTLISGILLYARFFSGGISFIWATGAGAAFTLGALAALVSYGMGVGIFGPTQGKIEALGAAMESAGGPPKPEQVLEMNRLQTGLMKAYRVDFILLVIAMATMAVARYL